MVKLLMTANQLDVNVKENYEWNTPLHLACEEGEAECVKLLLEIGADRSVTNKADKSPFQLAKPNFLQVIRSIIEST